MSSLKIANEIEVVNLTPLRVSVRVMTVVVYAFCRSHAWIMRKWWVSDTFDEP